MNAVIDPGLTNIVGAHWADSEKGAGIVDEKDKEDIKRSDFHSFFYDSDGTQKAMYAAYDEDDKFIGMFKTEVPDGAEKAMYETGMFDRLNSQIMQKIYADKEGILTKINQGYGSMTLPYINETVEFVGTAEDGAIKVNIPTSDGGKVAKIFSNANEVVSFLGGLTRLQYMKELEDNQTNQTGITPANVNSAYSE